MTIHILRNRGEVIYKVRLAYGKKLLKADFKSIEEALAHGEKFLNSYRFFEIWRVDMPADYQYLGPVLSLKVKRFS